MRYKERSVYSGIVGRERQISKAHLGADNPL